MTKITERYGHLTIEVHVDPERVRTEPWWKLFPGTTPSLVFNLAGLLSIIIFTAVCTIPAFLYLLTTFGFWPAFGWGAVAISSYAFYRYLKDALLDWKIKRAMTLAVEESREGGAGSSTTL